MTKRVMIIAGGEWQVPLIKKAKSMGHYIINTNLYPDSPGFEHADIEIIADVLDKEKNLQIALKYRPDAVITDQSDIAVPTVAYICERLGLPGIGTKKAELFTDKFLMREFCRNNGFPCPRYRKCSSVDEVKDFIGETGTPIILKPTANQSSRGVNKVETLQNLESLYADTLANSRDGLVLAEEYMGGTELTVEGFKTSERHYSLAVSAKEHLKENPSVACRLFYSKSHPDIDYERLKIQNDQMVENMGLPFGITHAEYKYWNNRFYLVEIAARGGGTKISSHIVPLLSGINTNELLIKMALGEDINSLQVPDGENYAVLDFFVLNEGKVRAINGVDQITGLNNVVDFGLNFKVGDYLNSPKDDRSRPGYFIACEKSKPALEELATRIKSILEVVYE